MKKQKYRYKTGVQCPECGDKIFSMYRHDYKHCSCGLQTVDGGDDYLKYSLATYKGKVTKIVKKRFPIPKKPTKKQIEAYYERLTLQILKLYNDSNN
mgnify:CR=1 FL=1